MNRKFIHENPALRNPALGILPFRQLFSTVLVGVASLMNSSFLTCYNIYIGMLFSLSILR